MAWQQFDRFLRLWSNLKRGVQRGIQPLYTRVWLRLARSSIVVLLRRRFGAKLYHTPAVLAVVVLLIAVPLLGAFQGAAAYQLSADTLKIINAPDATVARSVQFNARQDSFIVNPGALTPATDQQPNVLVGQPSKGLYSATLPARIGSGISVTDAVSHLKLTLVPEFQASSGRRVDQRIVYPLSDGSAQAIYTPQSTQLAEDLVVNHPGQNNLAFAYRLKLPKGLQSFQLADGSVGIERQGTVLFKLLAPTLKQSNGQPGGTLVQNSTKLVLKNDQLLLIASNLRHLSYPLSIDPSITINSATNFLNGNDEGGNAITTNQVSTGSTTGGTLNNFQTSCPTNWTLDTNSTWCYSANNTTSLPTPTYEATSVVYNGYVYEIGGSSTAVVDYAPIHSDGTLGTWQPTTSLPVTLSYPLSVTYNGYVYEIGGLYQTTSTITATVDYAPIHSDGTLGTWQPTTSLPVATYGGSTVTDNGYVYYFGGYGPNITATVDYAPIHSDGTLGTWQPTTSLPVTTSGATSVVYDGYVYEIGGGNGTSASTTTVDYAPFISNGSLGAWTSTTSLPVATSGATTVVYNGYVYEIGGQTSSPPIATVNYAPINANGTLGSWTATTNLPAATDNATSVVYNGYVYEIGGYTTAVTATINYAQITSAGFISSPTATTTNSWASTTAVPGTKSGKNTYYPDYATSVVYDGYVYQLGGTAGPSSTTYLATVDYAPLNSDGTIGNWKSTTSLPVATYNATTVVYNGYIYEMGGNTSVTTSTANVYYASISSTGTIGAWTSTTSLPVAISDATSVAYNGYVYEIGGNAPSSTNAVYYAQISSTGTLGSWQSAVNLLAVTHGASSVVYDGYVYEIGGVVAGNFSTAVDYAPINSDGTLGTWQPTTSLPNAKAYTGSVVYNGYVYEMDGGSSPSSAVYYAPLHGDGTLGSWSATTSRPVATLSSAIVAYNGYVYEIGGDDGYSSLSSVEYALINNGGTGTTGSYAATTSLPTPIASATSVAYNGYVYEIGGATSSAASSGTPTVDYAPINANGTLGSWQPTASLPIGTCLATSVAYNGYVYEIGGTASSGNNVATVDYAPIHSDGTLGTWQPTASLPANTNDANSVVYNGYVYEIGGSTTAVYYAPIHSDGTLGTWQPTVQLPISGGNASSVAYNGYVYEMGGIFGGQIVATVYYAPIHTDGTLGTWMVTTSLLTAETQTTSVAYNGYVYLIGGDTSSPQVEYTSINSNGTLGTWTTTTSLPAATDAATSVAYNGYIYEIGGQTTGTTPTIIAAVDYAPLNSIPHVANYSMLVNIGTGRNVTPLSIQSFGSNTGNPGLGGYAGYGGITVTYQGATTSCTTLSPLQTVNLVPPELSTAYNLVLSGDGCSTPDNHATYIWVHYHLDDSQTATFPDISGNHTTITGFQIFYHPASIGRLRLGKTFTGNTLQSLDAPPTTTQ
ncbi:MAG TPA: hypothetical protein VFN56_05470 [Candidatus Saccharimonadales bacterium]|nr:hypothetical protein [Candidatus Saccharimonadales bacterium]